MERTITINDTRNETLAQTKNDFIDLIVDELTNNPDYNDFDQTIDAIRYDGRDHETFDSNTPIYYHEIDSWYYLYSSELEEAYNNAGIYDKQPDNYKQVCIYLWLEQEVNEWLSDEVEEKINALLEYRTTRTDINSSVWRSMLQKSLNETLGE